MFTKVICLSLFATVTFAYTLQRPSDGVCPCNIKKFDCGYLENPAFRPISLQGRFAGDENAYFLPHTEQIHDEHTSTESNPNYPDAEPTYDLLDHLHKDTQFTEESVKTSDEDDINKAWSTAEVAKLMGVQKLPDHYVAADGLDVPISVLDEVPIEQSELTVEGTDMINKELEENYRTSYNMPLVVHTDLEAPIDDLLTDHSPIVEKEIIKEEITTIQSTSETQTVATSTVTQPTIPETYQPTEKAPETTTETVPETSIDSVTTETTTQEEPTTKKQLETEKNSINREKTVGEKILLKI